MMKSPQYCNYEQRKNNFPSRHDVMLESRENTNTTDILTSPYITGPLRHRSFKLNKITRLQETPMHFNMIFEMPKDLPEPLTSPIFLR